MLRQRSRPAGGSRNLQRGARRAPRWPRPSLRPRGAGAPPLARERLHEGAVQQRGRPLVASAAATPSLCRPGGGPLARRTPTTGLGGCRCQCHREASPFCRSAEESLFLVVGPPSSTRQAARVRGLLNTSVTCGNAVSEGGLEPPRPCGHQPLKLARLPIPPLRRGGRAYRSAAASHTRVASKVAPGRTSRSRTWSATATWVTNCPRGSMA